MEKSDANRGLSCTVCSKRRPATIKLSVANPRELMGSDCRRDCPSLESEGRTPCSSLIACESLCTKKSRVAIGDEMEDRFSNDDTAIEILSRLPIESSNELKCVCKRWREIFSHPSFSSAHFKRSARTISGIFVQATHYCACCENYLDRKVVDYISIGKEGRHATTTKKILDFLPEKVVPVASSNGILLCRNIFEACFTDHYGNRQKAKINYPKEVVLYVCNPFTKEWATLTPRGKM